MRRDAQVEPTSWQPARIAPLEQSALCALDQESLDRLKLCVGKLIRVMPMSAICAVCKQTYLWIHPDDLEQQLGLSTHEFEASICSSQVLTD